MNMFGFILFNRDVIAAEVARRTGKTRQAGPAELAGRLLPHLRQGHRRRQSSGSSTA